MDITVFWNGIIISSLMPLFHAPLLLPLLNVPFCFVRRYDIELGKERKSQTAVWYQNFQIKSQTAVGINTFLEENT